MFICIKTLPNPNIVPFTILLLSILYLISFPPLTKGLIAPLIPPLSPESPVYPEVLEANNITLSNSKYVTLDRDHYMTWVLAKTSVSPNELAGIYYKHESRLFMMKVHLGYPRQGVYGEFDTGSGLTWFRCEHATQDPRYSHYNQSLSSKYRIVMCNDTQKCKPNALRAIKGCDDTQACGFDTTYADGTWSQGVLSTDFLNFIIKYEKILVLFRFGCNYIGNTGVTGIVGGSNNEYSLPRQLYIDDPKFSYCISSDLTQISVIAFGPDAKIQGQRVNMHLNALTDFYYLADVVGFTVNKERINVSPDVYQMSDNGLKGFIIDSGTLPSYLTSVAFEALKNKLVELLGAPTQYAIGNALFELCYGNDKFVKGKPYIGLDFTNSSFEFKESNIWYKIPYYDLVCLLVINGKSDTINVLGSFQLLDYNVGYDPNNKALYFDKITCPNP